MYLILVLLLIVVAFLLMVIITKITLKNAKVYGVVNIPDGEYLRYGNYYEGKKYADLYVVTRQEKNARGGDQYRSYIEIISCTDDKMPSPDYRSWPSYVVTDAVIGSTVKSVANISKNVMNNWVMFKDVIHWDVEIDYEQKIGQSILRYEENGKISEVQQVISRVDPVTPSSCHWSTIFLQGRFFDFGKRSVVATVNPVYMSFPSRYVYNLAATQEMKTEAGTFNVKKFTTDMFSNLVVTPEGFGLFSKVLKDPELRSRKPAGPFAYYVEDSDRRLVVKLENSSGIGGDYILEEFALVGETTELKN